MSHQPTRQREQAGRERKQGRPPVRREALLDMLRRAIISGRAAPGSRMPSRAVLMARHRVSSITVQRTFDQLAEDGFVVSRGKLGTWVVKTPPHLYRYGLAFASNPGNVMYWRGLDRALLAVASARPTGEGWTFRRYFDTAGVQGQQELQALHDDIAAGRLAGLISAYGSATAVRAVRCQWPKFPVVEISAGEGPGAATVVLDQRSFFREALDCLKARQRQRVAILTGVRYPAEVLEGVLSQDARERGILVQPFWVQQIALTDPETAKGLMHLMMQGNPRSRPNGLIVADDKLTEHALAGLMLAGIRVPQDVEIVADANFPLPSAARPPIHRIGFSAFEILQACRTLLERRRQGGSASAPDHITIAARRDPHGPA